MSQLRCKDKECFICNNSYSFFEYITGISFKKWYTEIFFAKDIIIFITITSIFIVLSVFVSTWFVLLYLALYWFFSTMFKTWGVMIYKSYGDLEYSKEEQERWANVLKTEKKCSAGVHNCSICYNGKK